MNGKDERMRWWWWRWEICKERHEFCSGVERKIYYTIILELAIGGSTGVAILLFLIFGYSIFYLLGNAS